MRLSVVVVAMVLAGPVAEAMAGDGSTVSVGARTRGFRPTLVGEYWTGRFGFSAEIGGGGYDRAQTVRSQFDDTDEVSDDGWNAAIGGAAYYAAARGKRAQLSIGLRVAYLRSGSGDDERDTSVSASALEMSVPVRFELWVDKRVSIYTELGLGVRRSEQTVDGENVFGGVGEKTRQMFVFGDPLGNAGVSFHF